MAKPTRTSATINHGITFTHRLPAGISAKTLRALADLEERRQRGEIDEYAYERERNKILAADPAAGSN